MAAQANQAQDDPNLVEQIRQAAARVGLGQHQSAYRVPTIGFRKAVQGPAVLELIGLVGVLVGVLVKSESLIIFSAICCCIIGVFLLLAVVGARVNSGKDRDLRLDLYEHGLVQATGAGIRVVRYDNASVLQSIIRYQQTGGVGYHYTLSDSAGTTIKLTNSYPRPQEWGPQIQDTVTKVQLPVAWSALEAGRRLDFGPLWLTKSEIGGEQKSAPWRQIEEIKVHDGVVNVKQAGQWFSLARTGVSSIPNFFVFHALAEHLRKAHGRDGAAWL